MARPGDWSPLGLGGDPTPGDPEVVDGIVNYMKLIQQAASDADRGINTIMSGTGDGAFVGKTADWLREEIESKTKTFLSAVANAFETASPAMSTYAQKLRDAQAEADSALSQAQGLAEDDSKRETLKQQAEQAKSDLESAAASASSAVDSVAHATNPWAKSACEQFWDAFFWIVLLITVVAIFVGGPLGLIAFALNVVLAIKEIVDFAQGNSSIGELLLSLVGVLFPSTRALKLGDLVSSIKSATSAIAKGAWAGLKGLGNGLMNIFRNLTWSSITKNVTNFGNVVVTAVKTGAAWIPKAVVGGGAFVHGFVALPGTTISSISTAFVNGLGKIASAGVSKISGAIDAFLKTRFVQLTMESLGGWQALRIFLPMAGHEIRGLGVLNAFKVGILGRGLGISNFKNMTLIDKLGDTVQVVKGITMTSAGVYDAFSKVMKPELIVPGGGASGGLGNQAPALPRPIVEMPPIRQADVINRMPDIDTSLLRGPGGDFSGVKIGNNTTIADVNNSSWHFTDGNTSFSSTPSGIHVPNTAFSSLGDVGGADLRQFGSIDAIANSGAHVSTPAMGEMGGLNKLVLPQNLGNAGGLAGGLDGIKVPSIAESLGGAGAVGSLKAIGDLNIMTKVGNLTQLGQLGDLGKLGNVGDLGKLGQLGDVGKLGNVGDVGKLGNVGDLNQVGNVGDLNKLGSNVGISDGNVTLRPGNLQITDGNGAAINLSDLKVTNGAGAMFDLNSMKLTDGVASVSPIGLRVDAPGAGGMRFADNAGVTVDVSKVQVTNGTSTVGLNDLKFTDGNGVTFDLHSLKLTDGVNSVDLGADLRIINNSGGSSVNVGGITGLTEHLSTPGGLQGMLGMDQATALNSMQNMFPGAGGAHFAGTGTGSGGGNAFGSIHNAKLHADLSDFAFRELPKLMDNEFSIIKKTDEVVQISLSDDAVAHIGSNLTGGNLTGGGFRGAPVEIPNVRTDPGVSFNGGPAKQPVIETGGVHPEPQIAKIEAPGVNRVEDALSQLADVDVPRPSTADSVSAHTPDVDGAGGSVGSRPDLAGGEVPTPQVNIVGRDGQPLAMTPEGHVVDASVTPGGVRPETPNPMNSIDSTPAPAPRADPLAEVKHLADRLFPGKTDVVVTYQAAQGLLNQAQAAKAAGIEAGAAGQVAVQQINDVVVAERLLAKAEEKLAAEGLSGSQIDTRMAELDAADLKFAEDQLEIDIATQKQIDAIRDTAGSGAPVKGNDLFQGPKNFDPKTALGLDELDWRGQWSGLDKAQADLNFSNLKFDENTLRATLDSLGIDPGDYAKFVEARDLGPSPSQIQAYKDSRPFGPSTMSDAQAAKQMMELPGDRALREAINQDPGFQQFRDMFQGLWDDFVRKLGGDVDLGADRLKYAQWQTDPARVGDLPAGMEAGDIAKILRDRDDLLSLNGSPKDLPEVPGRDLDPPGGISVEGLGKVWDNAVDKLRANIQHFEHTPATDFELGGMFDDVMRQIGDGLPEAFARQARLEDELITSMPKFDQVVTDLRGKASWGDDLGDAAVDRAKINFRGELTGKFNQTLRDLDIQFTGRPGGQTAPEIDPKLQAMRDELFGDAAARAGDLPADYRGIGRYSDGLEQFADAGTLNQAMTDDAFRSWSAKVDDLAANIPDRLRFENEAGGALDDAGRRFSDMADGANADQKALDAIAKDYRESTAVAFHDAYGAEGSRRGWLNHEMGNGDAFGGGRAAQADWRSNQTWQSNQTWPTQPDAAPASPPAGHSAVDEIGDAGGRPGSSSGTVEMPDTAGSFKVEPVPAPQQVQELAQIPKVEVPKVEVPKVETPKLDGGAQVPRPQAENPFSTGQQLYANPAAALDHDIAVFETRFAEAGVPQSVTDSVLGNFRLQAEGLVDLHQASGHSLEVAMKAGVQYAGSVSAPVNLHFAYEQLLRQPDAWASFHSRVEVTAHRLESKAFAQIDAADLSHLSPAERLQVKVDALDTVADGVGDVLTKLYGTPGSIFTRADAAGADLSGLGGRLDQVLEQSIAAPPPAPSLQKLDDAPAQIQQWANDLKAHADARFDRIENTPLRQDLITEAKAGFSANLTDAVTDLASRTDDLAGANVRLEQYHADLLGQLRQGLTDAHVSPLSLNQILGDLVTGRSDWAQAMVDSLPGSPVLKSLEIVTVDGRTVVRPLGTDDFAPTGPAGDFHQPVLHIEPTATGQVPGLSQVADLIESLPPVLRPHDFVVHPSVPFTADELRIVLGADTVTGDAVGDLAGTGKIQELTDEGLRSNFELRTFESGSGAAADFDGWWAEQAFLAGAFLSGLAAPLRNELTDLARQLTFRNSGDGFRPSDVTDARMKRLDADVVPVTAALLGANLRAADGVTFDLVQNVRPVNAAAIERLDLHQQRMLGGGKEVAPTKEGLVHIQHPGYATGDQFGLLATLLANPNAQLVVLKPLDDVAVARSADSIKKFYDATGVEGRVRVAEGPTMADAKAEFKTQFNARKEGLGGKGKLLSEGVNFGTKYVKDFAPSLEGRFKDALKIDGKSMMVRSPEIAKWLDSKGITLSGDPDVLVLWSRFSGKKGQAHYEHDTSISGVKQMLDRLQADLPKGRQRVVVIAGDRHPGWGGEFSTKPKTHYADLAQTYRQNPNFKVADLTEFWNDATSHPLIKQSEAGEVRDFLTTDPRVNQFGVYEFLHLNSHLQHVGFRSGNLEAFTLAGHRVTYLEEMASVSGARMTQWADLGVNKFVNPHYDPDRVMAYPRMELSQPPSRGGQLYKLDELALKPIGDKLGKALPLIGSAAKASPETLAKAIDELYVVKLTDREIPVPQGQKPQKFSAVQMLQDALKGIGGTDEWLPAVKRISPAQKTELAGRLDDLAARLDWAQNGKGQWTGLAGAKVAAGPDTAGLQATLNRVGELIEPLQDYESTWVVALRQSFLDKKDANGWKAFKKAATEDLTRGFTGTDLNRILDRVQGNWGIATKGKGLAGFDSRAGQILGDTAEVRTTFPELAPVNPRLAQGGEFATNCVISFITLNIALREGGIFQAPPSAMWSQTELAAFQRQQLGLDDAAQPRVLSTGSLDSIRASMLKAGNGSTAALVFDVPGRGFGHVVNVVTRNDRVWFLDAQSGGPAVVPHGVNEFELWPMSPKIADPAGSHAVAPNDLTELPPLGGKGDLKPKDEFAKFVIVHPGFATGDQFGIMATLAHNPNAHVALIRPAADGVDGYAFRLAEQVRSFYEASGVMDRVHVLDTPSLSGMTDAVKDTLPDLKKRQPVNFGTKYVAEFAKNFGTEFKSALKVDSDAMAGRSPEIQKWLEGKGVSLTPDTDVVVLWSRFSGKKANAHLEHDTSLRGVEQILERLSTGFEGKRLVVIAGDRHPSWGQSGGKPADQYQIIGNHYGNANFKVADLTEFWNDPGAHHLIKPAPHLTSDARVNQLGIYEFLHQNARTQHVGFRSGNLEAFVLFGHQVTYLEENLSLSTLRMQAWKSMGVNAAVNPAHDPGRVMSYSLMEMDQAPSRSGQLYKLDELALRTGTDGKLDGPGNIMRAAGDLHTGLEDILKGADRPAAELQDLITTFRDDLFKSRSGLSAASRFDTFRAVSDGLYGQGEWLPTVKRLSPAQKTDLARGFDDLANRLGWFREGGAWQQDLSRAAFTDPADLKQTVDAVRRIEELVKPLSEYRSGWMVKLRADFLSTGDVAGWKALKAPFTPGFTTGDVGAVTGRIEANWALKGPSAGHGLAGMGDQQGRLLGDHVESRAAFGELAPVNPLLAKGGEFETNCVVATIALNIALREGGQFQAPPSEMWSQVELANFQRQRLGLEDGAAPRVLATGSLDSIRAAMLKAGDGAQAAMSFDVPAQGFGHVVNVVTRDGRVWFLDAQSGGAAVLPHSVDEVEFWPLSAQIDDPVGSHPVAHDELTPLGARGEASTGKGTGLKAKDEFGTYVITHQGFATGDQFGLLATLKHNPNAHVALSRPDPAGVDGYAYKLAESIRSFYDAAGVSDRVKVLDVANLGEFTDAVKAAFSGMKRNPLNFGTKYVAEFATRFGTGFKDALAIGSSAMAGRSAGIETWFAEKGLLLTPDTEVLVLWSRFSGKKANAHLEHDTSLHGVEQLLDGLQKSAPVGRQRVVVIAGDRHPDWGPTGTKPANQYQVTSAKFSRGDFRVVDLTEFWNDTGSHPLIKPGEAGDVAKYLTSDPRVNQFGVYEFLHQSARTQHLGFRSGNLEAFVLSGHHVTYLEENVSFSTGRMRTWDDLGVNKDVNPAYDPDRSMRYSLMAMEQAPTRSGQLYKLDELALTPIMDAVGDGRSGIAKVLEAADQADQAGQVAAIQKFRDGEPPKPVEEVPVGKKGKPAKPAAPAVPAFDQLREALTGLNGPGEWRPDVKRLSLDEKNELAVKFDQLTNRLEQNRFTQPSDTAATVDLLRRVSELTEPLTKYRSAWMMKLRADLLSEQGIDAWKALKAPFTQGFTGKDLGEVLGRVDDNWALRGPSSGRSLAGTTGSTGSAGPLLGDHAHVRTVFPELAPVNPRLAQGGEFATNCVIATITLSIAVREGGIFQAPPSAVWSHAELIAWQKQSLGLADSAEPRVLRTDSLDSIRTAMKDAGEDAQGALVFEIPGREHGHVVNVVTRDGQAWFLDAQAGGAARVPEGVTHFEFWPLSGNIADPLGSQALRLDELTDLPRIGSGSSAGFELQTLAPAPSVSRPVPTQITPAVLDSARSQAILSGLRSMADRLPMGLDELSDARAPLATEVVQRTILDALLGDTEASAFLAALDRVARLVTDVTLAEQMSELGARGAESFDAAVGQLNVQSESTLRALAENLAWAPFVADRFDAELRSADVDPQHERLMSVLGEKVEEQVDPLMVPGVENADWVRLAVAAGGHLVSDLADALVLVTMVRDLARLAASQDAAVLTGTTLDLVDRLVANQLDTSATSATEAQLPSGFGETVALPVAGANLVTGGQSFAFGPDGVAESFGRIGFNDTDFIAQATDFEVPPAVLGGLQSALSDYIAEFGATNAVRLMLEGGLTVNSGERSLTLTFQNVDRAQAHRVLPSQQPLLRSGETAAGPMDKLVSRSTAISQEISRTGTFDVSVFTSIAQGNAVVLPYGGINASSTTSRTQGFTLDSSTTETISTAGKQVYFDLPARLVSEVRVTGKRAVQHRVTQNSPLRVSFPEKLATYQPAPGPWITGSEQAPLTGALAAVMPGFGEIGGLGFLNRALSQALGLKGGSEVTRVMEHRMTETALRTELPRVLGAAVSLPQLPWTKGRSLVTHAGAEVLAVRRLGPPVEVPVQLDKGGSSSQFSAHGNSGTFGFTAGVAVSPAPLGEVVPYVAIGFPVGTGRGVALKNGLAAGTGIKVASSGKSVPYQVQLRYALSGELVTAGQLKPGRIAADLKSDLSVTVYVAEELAPVFERALHESARLPLPAPVVPTDVIRFAPKALSKPTGSAGFAGTLGLTGTQNLVRQFSGLLGQVQSTEKVPGQVRVDPWTRTQQLDLQDWLIERFGEPDLRQGQEEMFSEGGRSETYVRELNSGDLQHITFEISARRTSPEPLDSIPVKEGAIAVKPNSAFETTHSGSDTTTTGVSAGSRWNWSVPIPGTNRKFIGRLFANASATRGHTDTVDVLHSGSVTKPLSYKGPAWVYRYPSEVTLKVSVNRVLSRDLSSRMVQALETGGRKLAGTVAPELKASTQARFGALAGWMVPESFTSLENPLAEQALIKAPATTPGEDAITPALPELALAKVDHQLSRFAAGTEPGTRTQRPGDATSSWWQFNSGMVFSPLSDPYGTVEIRPIDRVRHVDGVASIRDALVTQLAEVGIDPATARLWALSNINSEHLRGLFVREATGQGGNVSQKLTLGDREAQYALIPVVHSVVDDGTSATFETGLSLEYSASAGVTGATTATFGIDLNARFGVSVVRETDANGNPAGGGTHVRFGPSFTQAEMRGDVQSLARSGGQSLKMDLKHTGRIGSVRWRVIAVSSRNVTESRRLDQHLGMRVSATDVDVNEGIQFFAPERTTFTLADLESTTPVTLPKLRAGEPRLIRGEAEPQTGLQRLGTIAEGETERVVPMAPVSDTDPTQVPEYPLVPLNSVPEYLMPRPGEASLARVNPVLKAAGDLLAQHEPGALTGIWQLQTPGTTMRGGLDVMLTPQALTAQSPVLRAGGLLLTRVDGKFLGQRVTQLLIRLNRDPRSRGYLTTEGNTGTLGSTNRGDQRSGKSWSTTRTVNLSAGLTGIVDGVARPTFAQSQFVAELARGWNTGTGGSYAFAPMRYDGFETKGDINMLLGEIDVEVTLISVWRPSPLLNTVGLGAPMSLSRQVQKVTASTPTGTAARVGSRVVPLGESVVVSSADLIRRLPAGTGQPIVSRLDPGRIPAGSNEIRFTGAELTNKEALLRIDPDKVRYFYDAWTRALEQHAGSPALLAAWGQIGQDELRALSDPAVLENHLLKTGTGAGAEDAQLPVPLRSTGSVLTDTTGSLSVSFRLIDPKVSADFPAAQVNGKVDVMTATSIPGGRQDLAGSARGGAPNTLNSANPASRQAPTPLAVAAPMYSGKTKVQAGGSQKTPSEYTAWSLDTTWYGPVYLDAVVTVTLRTSNQRDKIRYGGTELPLTFRVRNLVEASYSPQRLVRDAGLRAWAGAPVPVSVPSGWYLPAAVGDSAATRKLLSAQSFPKLEDVVVVHTAFDAPEPKIPVDLSLRTPVPARHADFRVYGENVSPTEFAERYLTPILQHNPELRVVALVSDSLPPGTDTLAELARAAGLPSGVSIVALTGPLGTPFGDTRIARPDAIEADVPVHTAIDVRNAWEIVETGKNQVTSVRRTLHQALEGVLGRTTTLEAPSGDSVQLEPLRPAPEPPAQVDLSQNPLVAGLGDVAMQRSKGPKVFEAARVQWLRGRAAEAHELLSTLTPPVRGELREAANVVVGRASGHNSGLTHTNDPGSGLLRAQVIPIATALLHDAAQFTNPVEGNRLVLSEPAVRATEAMVSTLVHALGLQRLRLPGGSAPSSTARLAAVVESLLGEGRGHQASASDVGAPVEQPEQRDAFDPVAEFQPKAIRGRLTALSGADPARVEARRVWWHELAEQAELVANGFDPVAVAPLSYVANAMVANRLSVAEGAADLDEEAREQVRAELSVVLLATLLQSWSAQGGTGLPGREVVRPVAELADDLVEQVFLLGRPEPPKADAPKAEAPEPAEPVAATPVVHVPRGVITATGADVLGALLDLPGNGGTPVGADLVGATDISEPEKPANTVAQTDPTDPTDPIGPGSPATSHRPGVPDAQPSDLPPGAGPSRPVPTSTPGLIAPIKIDLDQEDREQPTSPFTAPAAVEDALALLAPDLEFTEKVTDPTQQWNRVGPVAKKGKDVG